MRFVKSELVMLSYASLLIAVIVAASMWAKAKSQRSDAGEPVPHAAGSDFDKMRGMTAEEFISQFEGADKIDEYIEVPR